MFETIRLTFRFFSAHGGRVLGAATAFYALMAAAPMLLMAVVVTGWLTDEAAARASVIQDVSLWVGADAGTLLSDVLTRLAESHDGMAAGIVGTMLLLWAGVRLFSQLRYSLNHLWDVREAGGRGLGARARRQARKRLGALLMVAIVVVVIAVTIVAKTALTSVMGAMSPLPARWHVADFAFSFFLLTVVFAMVFKVMPAVRMSWPDVFAGGLATALLFSLGAVALSWYLRAKSTSSTYGAAGSVVAVLLWVNYSAQAFFLGAAFTRVRAERHGDGFTLESGAIRLTEQMPPSGVPGSETIPAEPESGTASGDREHADSGP